MQHSVVIAGVENVSQRMPCARDNLADFPSDTTLRAGRQSDAEKMLEITVIDIGLP